MVEFGVVLPIMLVLFIGIADLGRIFAVTVVSEAATRNAAEVAAFAYLSDPPGSTGLDQAVAGATPEEYLAIHARARDAVCEQMRALPNTAGSGSDCSGMPFIRVCVHDGADPTCGSEAFDATISTDCTETRSAISNSQDGGYPERWVEVRICYRFTPILQAPIFSFGDIWVERSRTFGIPCYFVLGTANCG
jgi:hypothetical protein